MKVDPERRHYMHEGDTGIYVRALDRDKWVSADIACLDKESLLSWLRSRGGDNQLAEDTIGILFGHGHLHEVNPHGKALK